MNNTTMNTTITTTRARERILDEDIDAIARRVVELIRDAQAPAFGGVPEAAGATVGIREVMRMVGAGSRRAAYRTLAELGVRAWRRGKYRWHDVNEAVARRNRTWRAKA